jgi:hypothetical protein
VGFEGIHLAEEQLDEAPSPHMSGDAIAALRISDIQLKSVTVLANKPAWRRERRP